MFDMMKMMGQVKEMQAKMKEAQENLKYLRETGEAGAGMVKATVDGKKQVISIEIDESLMNKEGQGNGARPDRSCYQQCTGKSGGQSQRRN